ncbi:MAG: hypothetical protein QM644_05330 [Mobilitalea sp.]
MSKQSNQRYRKETEEQNKTKQSSSTNTEQVSKQAKINHEFNAKNEKTER